MASIEEAKEIIKSTAISTIVNFYHPISKRGANFEGICPFHSDTNPSLKLNDDKGIYKCFVCGAAGDAIKFVQDKANLEFVDAIKEISSQLGISIDEVQKNKDPKFDMALRVLNASNKIYRKVASEHTPEVYKEFQKSRGLTDESLETFQIGYAPGNSAVTKYLNFSVPGEQRKLAIEVASKIGLIRVNQRGQGHYDFFRDRVTFPVWDHAGKIRGYSSRAVLKDQKPKYLNSGESFIFDKGNILFGFNFAKKHIREKDSVLVVEGNMDVIMLHQYGFKNSVATQGVALSANSIKLLGNMTKNIILAMDSDPAGIAAMGKINQALLSDGLIAKFLSFSPFKDPDEFLINKGSLALQELIDSAPSFIDFQISEIIKDPVPSATDKKLGLLQDIFKLLSPLKLNLMATEKVIQCAKSLGLKSSSDDIIAEYKNFLDNLERKGSSSFKKSPPKVNEQPQPTENIATNPVENFMPTSEVQTIDFPKVQRVLLEILLTHPECVEDELVTEILDFIDHFEVKRIVQWLRKIYLEIDEADYPLFVQEKLKESLPEQIKTVMASSLNKYDSLKLNQKIIKKMMEDLLHKLKIEALIKERDNLRLAQKQCDTDEESLEVIKEIQKIEGKLSELRNK